MDILSKRYPSSQIVPVVNALTYRSGSVVVVPQLVGTGALKSQQYPADYDFLCFVTKPGSKPYAAFKDIFSRTAELDNLYFIELKFQGKDDKHKIFREDEFTEELFNKWFPVSEYIKYDFIINETSGTFKEVSCIYFFGKDEFDKPRYANALLADQKDYYEEGKYYKSLKRLMVAAKAENPPDRKLIVKITKLFNSDIGKLYQVKNEIDAAIIFLERYPSAFAKRMVDRLRYVAGRPLTVQSLKDLSESYGDLIDGAGLKFYKANRLKPGRLPNYEWEDDAPTGI